MLQFNLKINSKHLGILLFPSFLKLALVSHEKHKHLGNKNIVYFLSVLLIQQKCWQGVFNRSEEPNFLKRRISRATNKHTAAGQAVSSWDLTCLTACTPIYTTRMAFAPYETKCHSPSDSPSNTNPFYRAAAQQLVPVLHFHSWLPASLSGFTSLLNIPLFAANYTRTSGRTFWIWVHHLKCLQPFLTRCGLQI